MRDETMTEIGFKISAAKADLQWYDAIANLIAGEIESGKNENDDTVREVREYLTANGLWDVQEYNTLSNFLNVIKNCIDKTKTKLNSIYGEKAKLENMEVWIYDY